MLVLEFRTLGLFVLFLNFGTSIMGPEVYLKALSMARNVAHQKGEKINRFTTAVFDLQDLVLLLEVLLQKLSNLDHHHMLLQHQNKILV